MTEREGLLTARCALITGASSGIGAAAARVFSREGARVMLAARREEELAALTKQLRNAGCDAAYTVTDVSSDREVAWAVQATLDRFGALDVAFNNAGVALPHSPLHLTSAEAYDTLMDTNVRGVWHCLRHEVAAMLGRGGAIVNTSSTAGAVATPAAAPYIASKHAVNGLTKAAAAEYAGHGIRVNAIAPGTTRSEMIRHWFDLHPEVEGPLLQRALLPRIADPEEIAEAAAWLCSERASFLTGAVVPVDGGWTAR
ncbi:SDR family NAD(P)-dependent oxidoreductase [Streptomyces puniciscabiei]|uniref:SDR family NAD(P)-dependent oxidoreductase n=1 Tax=Streptomyces puniciscabiei TaxID=164348 RepID=UPI0033342992